LQGDQDFRGRKTALSSRNKTDEKYENHEAGSLGGIRKDLEEGRGEISKEEHGISGCRCQETTGVKYDSLQEEKGRSKTEGGKRADNKWPSTVLFGIGIVTSGAEHFDWRSKIYIRGKEGKKMI